MPPVTFEPTTPAGERPQTYALDRAATGTGIQDYVGHLKCRVNMFPVLLFQFQIRAKRQKKYGINLHLS
jgi:hypothetical protein